MSDRETPAPVTQMVGWIYEDELPKSYPYDAMFPHSKVDGVRMFPVFAPSPQEHEMIKLRAENEALTAFVRSFHFTCDEANFYKDCYLGIHAPESVTFKLGSGSQFSRFISGLEARRSTLAAAKDGQP